MTDGTQENGGKVQVPIANAEERGEMEGLSIDEVLEASEKANGQDSQGDDLDDMTGAVLNDDPNDDDPNPDLDDDPDPDELNLDDDPDPAAQDPPPAARAETTPAPKMSQVVETVRAESKPAMQAIGQQYSEHWNSITQDIAAVKGQMEAIETACQVEDGMSGEMVERSMTVSELKNYRKLEKSLEGLEEQAAEIRNFVVSEGARVGQAALADKIITIQPRFKALRSQLIELTSKNILHDDLDEMFALAFTRWRKANPGKPFPSAGAAPSRAQDHATQQKRAARITAGTGGTSSDFNAPARQEAGERATRKAAKEPWFNGAQGDALRHISQFDKMLGD